MKIKYSTKALYPDLKWGPGSKWYIIQPTYEGLIKTWGKTLKNSYYTFECAELNNSWQVGNQARLATIKEIEDYENNISNTKT